MKKRLGELLIECGVIDERQLGVALAYQQAQRCKLGTALVDLAFAGEEQVVAALARKLGFRRANLDLLEQGAELEAAMQLVPRELAAARGVFPVAATRSTLSLAAHDPTDLGFFDDLAFRTGRRVEILLAGEREVARTVARLMYRVAQPVDLVAEPGDGLELVTDWAASCELELEPAAPGGAPAPPAPGFSQPLRERVDAGERLVAQAIEQLLHSSEASSEVTAARLVAALVRVLTRDGVIDRRDLAAELVRAA